jgi:hypothetical protein
MSSIVSIRQSGLDAWKHPTKLLDDRNSQCHSIVGLGTMEIAATERLTIDLDTGGTFTDGYVSGARGAIRSKVDTTPHDLTEGI